MRNDSIVESLRAFFAKQHDAPIVGSRIREAIRDIKTIWKQQRKG